MGAAYQLRRNDMGERNGKEARNLSKHWGIIHEGKGYSRVAWQRAEGHGALRERPRAIRAAGEARRWAGDAGP